MINGTLANLYCWGFNRDGQCGVSPEESVCVRQPRRVKGSESIEDRFLSTNSSTQLPTFDCDRFEIGKLCCGFRHTVMVTKCNAVFGWGSNSHGQLALPPRVFPIVSHPVRIDAELVQVCQNIPPTVHNIAAGGAHTLLVLDGGRRCFVSGRNDDGELGLGDCESRSRWTPLLEMEDELASRIVSVSCGYQHSCYAVDVDMANGYEDRSHENECINYSKSVNKLISAGAASQRSQKSAVSFNKVRQQGDDSRHDLVHLVKHSRENPLEPVRTYLRKDLWQSLAHLRHSAGCRRGDIDAFFAFFMSGTFLQFFIIYQLVTSTLINSNPDKDSASDHSLRQTALDVKYIVRDMMLPGIALCFLFSHSLFILQGASLSLWKNRKVVFRVADGDGTVSRNMGLHSSDGSCGTLSSAMGSAGGSPSGGAVSAPFRACCLPHGLNSPVLFAYISLILQPVYQQSGDLSFTYLTMCACCFYHGLFQLLLAPFSAEVRVAIPTSSLFASLAGTSITFLSLDFAFEIFAQPLTAILPLTLVFVCFVSGVRFGPVPAGLLPLLMGMVLKFLTGDQFSNELSRVLSGGEKPVVALGSEFSHLKYDIMPEVAQNNASGVMPFSSTNAVGRADLFPSSHDHERLSYALPKFLGVEIFRTAAVSGFMSFMYVGLPFTLLNYLGNLGNLESAKAAGDNFHPATTIAIDSISTMVGALFGNPFPTNIMIGQPAFKKMGGKVFYTIWNCLAATFIAVFCLVELMQNYVPLEAVVTVILWVGVVITAQCFTGQQDVHAVAIALGLLPGLASWVVSYLTKILTATQLPGSTKMPTIEDILKYNTNGFLGGAIALRQGSVINAIVWASIYHFLEERHFGRAAIYCFFAACCSAIGLIHSFRADGNNVWSVLAFYDEADFVPRRYFAYAYLGSGTLLACLSWFRVSGDEGGQESGSYKDGN